MTPYEAIFGQAPLTLLDYMVDSTSIAAVDDLLSDWSAILCTLKDNLQRAQVSMKNQTDFKHINVFFEVIDWVFLQLQPFRQLSLHLKPTHKLSKCFVGPFQIMAKIGPAAYRLTLPPTTQPMSFFTSPSLNTILAIPICSNPLFPIITMTSVRFSSQSLSYDLERSYSGDDQNNSTSFNDSTNPLLTPHGSQAKHSMIFLTSALRTWQISKRGLM